jgi:hypothetical protein
MEEDLESFRGFLQKLDLDSERIETSVAFIREYNDFLSHKGKSLGNASYDDMYDFSDLLIENQRNTFDNYATLYRYGQFKKSNELIIASLEIIDGSEMIENFSNRLQDEFGEETRNEIFEGLGQPPLGIRPKTKADITKKLVDRFLAKFGHETCKAFFEVGLRDKYTDSYLAPKQLFKETGNIDEFLTKRRLDLLERLKNHHQDGTLFFTQEIDDDVISYVEARPTIEGGIRDGDRVVITKIPYMTKQFIHASDEKMQRYYFCHNPWIREALKEEDQPIDPIFCGCSAGYFKNFWEAVLGQPVRVEVLRSFINGDDICEFALHLPTNVIGVSNDIE